MLTIRIFNKTNSFNHCEKLQADPFMCLITDGTGSDKTYLLFQMLTTSDILNYERLVILTTTPNQPYFQFLKHGLENNLKKSVINKLFSFYTKGEVKGNIDEICQESSKYITQRETIPVALTKEIADLEQVNPEKVKTIVIFDDCITERNQSVQCKIFTKGRHINCHSIHLTQSFYDVENIICKNANVFILFEQSNKSLTCILQSIKTGLPNEDFKQLAKQQWYEPNDCKYILVNTRKWMDYRCFTEIFS